VKGLGLSCAVSVQLNVKGEGLREGGGCPWFFGGGGHTLKGLGNGGAVIEAMAVRSAEPHCGSVVRLDVGMGGGGHGVWSPALPLVGNVTLVVCERMCLRALS
jgi:hypothetical protein